MPFPPEVNQEKVINQGDANPSLESIARLEDTSQKVMGSNPGAGKEFFNVILL